MITKIMQMFGTAATSVDVAFNPSQDLDYKTLNKYILRINMLKEVRSILSEASECLKEILNLEIFAFGLRNTDILDVWIYPGLDEKWLLRRIQEDLECQSLDMKLNYFKDEIDVSGLLMNDADGRNLLTFTVTGNKCSAKLYILPDRKMQRYHDEINESVLNAVTIALENTINIRQLESVAFIDILTGCYNRRALDSYIDHSIADAQRYGRDLSVIMFDLDHFKMINDTYGHDAGDIVLSEVSRLVSSADRKSDYIARYGGEEFILVLSNTELACAADLAERLRKKIEIQKINIHGMTVSVTASFGVAALKSGYDRAQLFLDADRMLYRAKARGRNNVMHEKLSFSNIQLPSCMLNGEIDRIS